MRRHARESIRVVTVWPIDAVVGDVGFGVSGVQGRLDLRPELSQVIGMDHLLQDFVVEPLKPSTPNIFL